MKGRLPTRRANGQRIIGHPLEHILGMAAGSAFVGINRHDGTSEKEIRRWLMANGRQASDISIKKTCHYKLAIWILGAPNLLHVVAGIRSSHGAPAQVPGGGCA
ncbi:MAG: hypothetical protein R3E42_17500 [Burkholderiaceae bacterium]